MLSSLRGPDGGPALHVRLLAALVILGMLLLAAPFVLVPVLRYVVDLIL